MCTKFVGDGLFFRIHGYCAITHSGNYFANSSHELTKTGWLN
jgi:hypothetical protein